MLAADNAHPSEAFPVAAAPEGQALWMIPEEVSFPLSGPVLPEDTASGIALYQPYLDHFSWQMFIAVNWPACLAGQNDCSAGEPDKAKWIGAGGDSTTVWEQWANADDVFRENGAEPRPWGSEDVPPACKGKIKGNRGPVFTITGGSENSRNESSNRSLHGYLQFDARETGPLIDQRGRWTRFESYLNKAAYDYIVDENLYSAEGQIAFADRGETIEFPPVLDPKGPNHNSIEIKAAWKILDDNDQASRYHTADGLFIDADGGCERVPVGLVAMHIMTKTLRTPLRVWSTFEHVDNLCRHVPIDTKRPDKGLTYASGAFCNAECRDNPTREGCAPNRPPSPPWEPARPSKPGDATPTQVTRVRPLPLGLTQLNALMSRLLAGFSSTSVWQNYELVGTQWVMPLVSNLNSTIYRAHLNIENSGPAPQYVPRIGTEVACDMSPSIFGRDSPEFVGCVGLVVPSILGSSLIETYNQSGASCLGCHQTAKTRADKGADFSFLLSRAQ
ncbi:hypothetical protein WME91_39565 [Sorangium sp. So ce269]